MLQFPSGSEAANMGLNRMNTVVEVGPTEGTNALVFTDQPLLNRSLSDLKLPGHLQVKHDLQPKLHSSSGQKNVINDSRESVTAQNEPCNQYKSINEDKETLSEDSAIDSSEHFFSHESQAASRLKPPSIGDHADIPHGDSLWSSPGVRGHPSMEDMAEMCKLIGDQKGVIMNCLVSENCDIVTLNQQISVLKNMQEDYAKLEFELSRNLWITAQNSSNKETLPEDNLRSFDEQFSTLVEQEVDRRLFQEKVLKTESEYHERERLRIQNERELDRVRRQHEKEVYLLKKKLFEASSTAQDSGPSLIDGFHNIHHNQIQIAIPHFHLPSSDHVVFEVIITSKDATWTIFRRFRQFRDLHITQSSLYGATVTGLSFPSRRLFGNTSKTVSHQRQLQLQTYLNSLVQRCSLIPASPLYQSSCQAALVDFSDFFKPDAIS